MCPSPQFLLRQSKALFHLKLEVTAEGPLNEPNLVNFFIKAYFSVTRKLHKMSTCVKIHQLFHRHFFHCELNHTFSGHLRWPYKIGRRCPSVRMLTFLFCFFYVIIWAINLKFRSAILIDFPHNHSVADSSNSGLMTRKLGWKSEFRISSQPLSIDQCFRNVVHQFLSLPPTVFRFRIMWPRN